MTIPRLELIDNLGHPEGVLLQRRPRQSAHPDFASVTIRAARDDDEPGLVRVAQLDSRSLPAGRLLVAEVDGELVAAVSLDDGASVANPYRPTAAIVRLLELRAQQPRSPGAIRRAARTVRWKTFARRDLVDAVPAGTATPCPTARLE